MSILVTGPLDTEWTTLSNNSATTIFTPTNSSRTTVVEIGASETNGGTQTLAVWVLQKSGALKYLRRPTAVTAGQRVLISEKQVLHTGDVLRAQSGDASGYFDISVTYLL